jgi:cation/acetate symporter
MIYEPSTLAVTVFFLFVAFTLGLSFYLGGKAKSSQGYFAAHGQIPWFVNGVAFAGDYLSAASFLGICGMIAFYGYDGFLYSIGFLAGWIVALFVVAEPMKRLGKFTFADALNAKFHSPGIKLAAGISTLAVSVFYLIPQMVGAGVLIQPLLGFPQWMGVLIVGATVVVIVLTAGMVSTTWVQFLKGSLLVVFSLVLTVMILSRGFKVDDGGFQTLGPFALTESADLEKQLNEVATELQKETEWAPFKVLPANEGGWAGKPYLRLQNPETQVVSVWRMDVTSDGQAVLRETQTLSKNSEGVTLVNGLPKGIKKGEPELKPIGFVSKLPGGEMETGPLGPFSFFSTLQQSEVMLWSKEVVGTGDDSITVYYQKPTPGSQILRPGEHPKFKGIRKDSLLDRLNFLSLMIALFAGTASLPHILIRYYTVKDESSARKSTIVGIASIGFFYVLTLYLGLGAMTSGALDVTDGNMAAPLLAKSMNEWLFAIISAIAFTTVLGTVSGLILASSGAVTHDLLTYFFKIEVSDAQLVRIAKIAAVVVGVIAIVLGIQFQGMNVSYLVGWAFSVAASANLPSLIMVLFWRGVTRQGVIAAILVGMTSSLAWILLSADSFTQIYGMSADDAIVPFSQPGIVTIPLGFVVLVVVSLMTQHGKASVEPESQ